MKRNRNIVMKSQFNINGSRGKSVKSFITDYVSRDSAGLTSMAYLPPVGKIIEQGDGVAFTQDSTAISRQEVLDIADKVESHFLSGGRAIQQFVISFDPIYLQEQQLVDKNERIIHKGDYMPVYDDVRLRHALRQGVQTLLEEEGYRDGKFIGCIQHDTLHLHAHVVAYEDQSSIGRRRGNQEKGVLKQSSMGKMTHEINRSLILTKPTKTPCVKSLTVEPKKVQKTIEKPIEYDWKYFMDILYIRQQQQDAFQQMMNAVDLDKIFEHETQQDTFI